MPTELIDWLLESNIHFIITHIIDIVELVRKLVKLRGGNKSSWLKAIKVLGTMVDLRVDSWKLSTLENMVSCHHRERAC